MSKRGYSGSGSKHLNSKRKKAVAVAFHASRIEVQVGEGETAQITQEEPRVWVTLRDGSTLPFVQVAEVVLEFWAQKLSK